MKEGENMGGKFSVFACRMRRKIECSYMILNICCAQNKRHLQLSSSHKIFTFILFYFISSCSFPFFLSLAYIWNFDGVNLIYDDDSY